MRCMKQLLLRVPDDLHQRLAARARAANTSVNALATQALTTAVGGEPTDARTRVRLKAAALGILVEDPSTTTITAKQREAAIKSTRGMGAIADSLIDYERGSR
jgi:plasmid stability protein